MNLNKPKLKLIRQRNLVIKKRGTKDTKGTVKLINLKQTDNAMAKNEKDKQKNNSTHDTT